MRRRRQNEGGYALLLVFALAAAVAVKLYIEMPRVAFEHQRDKEGLLVERGEEFVRAIKLYYRKNQKWPQNIEELEKTQETRYLRKRYKDPMTGEDEWRLVHVDGAGQFTDSLVHKKPGEGEGEDKGPSLLAARVQGIGASAEVVDPGGEAGSNNPALQRRASDKIIPGTTGQGNVDLPDSSAAPGEGGDRPREGVPVPPEGSSGTPGTAQGQAGSPGQAPVRNDQGGRPGTPAGAAQGDSTGSGFGMSGGFGFGGSGSPAQGSSGSAGTGATSVGFGAGGRMQGGTNAQGQPNEALRLINQILSSPRQGAQQQGGAFGASGRGTGVATGIGGLAGVASKKDMDGIMVYNEQTNYKKWEFIYDLKKEMQAKGMGGNQLPGQGTNPANQTGTGQGQQRPGTSSGSAFGSGFGSQGSQGGTSQPKPSSGSGFGFGKQ
jgi:hypothetical protein